ncbi:hypothetical protein BU24DRAFT_201374 [Aaosphaeria arxii CBS 175.79]|uniref:Uncharacterized protein n=1 Tax=Aaosphaeria arxii CBS 175.79 TaxID=1450172 RepID=A0A6A5XTZ5_9PLEO|nr:uncharacterized protein BU24DRAFT_201374 [Aaosphaeria arxii CBS 175.79]KAF2016423.1 hypothetical protein BU24DRAFT_201374 [Aaosphaeria arxii CBS 175.79]
MKAWKGRRRKGRGEEEEHEIQTVPVLYIGTHRYWVKTHFFLNNNDHFQRKVITREERSRTRMERTYRVNQQDSETVSLVYCILSSRPRPNSQPAYVYIHRQKINRSKHLRWSATTTMDIFVLYLISCTSCTSSTPPHLASCPLRSKQKAKQKKRRDI